MKVVFILGSGHCGSTLLDLILDSHSKIAGIGEIENLNKDVMCTCGKRSERCSFWSSILNKFNFEDLKVRRKKLDFLLGKDRYYMKKPGRQKLLKNTGDWIKNNEGIYEEVLKKSGAEIIVDSSKSPDKVELLTKSKNIEPIVIHLVRDGRAVSWSYIKKYKKALPYMWKWLASNLKIEILKRRNKFNYIFVRYENLVRNPEKTIKKILFKIDSKYESGILDFRNFVHHEIGGNRMRLKKESEIKEDIGWKQKMPRKYKILFNLLFGWLNFYYKCKK